MRALTKRLPLAGIAAAFLLVGGLPAGANTSPQALPFEQTWVDTSQITADDNWSGVPGIVGFRGDGLTGATGVDPQTVLAESTVVDVNANQTTPNTFTTGGVTEFHLTDPVVALQGSGTARAPHITVNLTTTGFSAVRVTYDLRDVDGSADNAVQPVALQYRIGASGNYTNVPAAFVADATTGGAATQVTHVDVVLPSAVNDQPLVQVRWITTDAVGSDEWVGIDDIHVTGATGPVDDPPAVQTTTPADGAIDVAVGSDIGVTFNEPVNVTGSWYTISCSSSGSHTATVTGGPSSFTLDPDTDFANSETCTVTITGAQVTDQDTIDPPDAMADDHVFSFTTVAPQPKLVLSQVYGGGGNAGATLTNDFIEIFNRGSSAVSLNGWSVQYASATGSTWQVTALTNVLVQPGQYYLVQELAGAGGTVPLPTPDATGTIPMSATAGKVALVSSAAALGGACPSTGAIVDFAGYGTTASCFEGSGPAPAPSNATADLRGNGGCTDTDNNAADFASGSPTPRNTAAPFHSCNGPTGVGAANPASVPPGDSTLLTVAVTPGFDPVSTGLGVSCNLTEIGGSSPQAFFDDGSHGDVTPGDGTFSFFATVAAATAPGTKTLPCTVSDAQGRSNSASIPLGVEGPLTPIHTIQGATHISPFDGMTVSTRGIVTGVAGNGFWIQDPNPDADTATAEGIFVFTNSVPTTSVGDSVRASGSVQEFRPGGATNGNLTTTELSGSPVVTVLSTGNPLPTPTVIGTGGRIPPDTVIEDDATGSVETSGVFDPDQDGLDFYESLEGMRVQLNNAVAVGPTETGFGETPVIGDDGAHASVRTNRGGILLRENDGNPERMTLDDQLAPLPTVNVGDHYSGPIVGIMDYNFGNPFVQVTTTGLTAIHDGVTREVSDPASAGELAVATFNFENLAATNPQSKFDSLASLIVNNLRSPDLIGGEEVQDNNGAAGGTVDASQTLTRLVNAIQAAGGPTYDWREIDPVDGADGGEPGGNIRQVFLFRTDRGLSFVDRPGGGSTTPNAVTGTGASTQLQFSPGRIDPTNPAFNASRKPLAAEFSYRGHTLFAIVNHFNSKGGDDPLRGRFQPPVRSSEVQRHAQAHILADFVSDISTADPNADVVVLGDLNDFEFSETVQILEDAGLHDLMGTLPLNQRYSYEFEGNAQVLDHIMFSGHLFERPLVFDPVHVNAEFFDQASDHDPSVVRALVNDPPTATLNAPASSFAGFDFELSLTNPSGPEPGEAFTYAFDCGSGYGAFAAASTRSCPTTDVGDRSVGAKIRDDLGAVTEYRGTVHVVVTFDSLCDLVRSYARRPADANTLCGLLEDAESAPNPKTKNNLLKEFRKTVDAKTGTQGGKSFTAEQGAELKLLSTRL